MSRVSGWSTSQDVYYPTTAKFSRCSTIILFKPEKLPGKHKQASEEQLIHNTADWGIANKTKHFSWSLNSPLPQVGPGGTFQVQIQSAWQQQCSTGEVVAEKTHRSLLSSSKSGRAKGLLPVPELAPPPHTPQQDLRRYHWGWWKGQMLTATCSRQTWWFLIKSYLITNDIIL